MKDLGRLFRHDIVRYSQCSIASQIKSINFFLKEDEHGQIKPLDTAQEQREKRQRQAESSGARIRRGMIRYLYLILDFSRVRTGRDRN